MLLRAPEDARVQVGLTFMSVPCIETHSHVTFDKVLCQRRAIEGDRDTNGTFLRLALFFSKRIVLRIVSLSRTLHPSDISHPGFPVYSSRQCSLQSVVCAANIIFRTTRTVRLLQEAISRRRSATTRFLAVDLCSSRVKSCHCQRH